MSAFELSRKITIVAALGRMIMPISACAALPGQAGLVNGVVGEALENGVPISNLNVGTALLGEHATVDTKEGLLEVLLAPGSVLRLGARSRVVFSFVSATDLRVELKDGQALVEVLSPPMMPVVIQEDQTDIALGSVGLYFFDRQHKTVSVCAGAAILKRAGTVITIGAGEGIRLPHLKTFQALPDTSNQLIAWSGARDQYLGQVSADLAATGQEGGSAAGRPDWYWDRFWNSYSMLPEVSSLLRSGYSVGPPPVTHGDAWLYAPPVIPRSSGGVRSPDLPVRVPSLPLSAPGEPRFASPRYGDSANRGGFGPPP